jgi:hypothetical protein
MSPASFHFALQSRDLLPGKFPHLSFFQMTETHGPDCQTMKANDRIAELFEHAPDLPVFPLRNHDTAPPCIVGADGYFRGTATDTAGQNEPVAHRRSP